MENDEYRESKEYLGLKRLLTIDLDCSRSEFRKIFNENVAPQNFFTSFTGVDEIYHGTIDNGREFKMKERRGLTGSKKVIPVIKGQINESNFKTRLEISVGFDLRTILPFLLPFIIFPVLFAGNEFPPFFFGFIMIILPIVYFFQMKYYVNKTVKELKRNIAAWE